MSGKLVIISAPSGGGKNTVIHELLEIIPNSTRFVTTTTRQPRTGEQEGVDYHYISQAEFLAKVEAGDFVEYNVYADNYYGADKQKLMEALGTHDVVFAALDINGKQHVDAQNIDHLSVFLLPESFDILKERIMARSEMPKEELKKRLNQAKNELVAAAGYDLQVVNKQGELLATVEKIAAYTKENLDKSL